MICNKMTTQESLPPPRPYTKYNFFFQMERERILQNMGVVQALETGKVFSTSDPDYDGPDLPPRYKSLILPYDWYMPGKGRRKKRQHVATHGKISFVDLSKRVADSWRNVDKDTKIFCSQLYYIGMQKYKKELKRYKILMHQQLEQKWAETKNQKKEPDASNETDKSSKNIETTKTGTLMNNDWNPESPGNKNYNVSPSNKSTSSKEVSSPVLSKKPSASFVPYTGGGPQWRHTSYAQLSSNEKQKPSKQELHDVKYALKEQGRVNSPVRLNSIKTTAASAIDSLAFSTSFATSSTRYSSDEVVTPAWTPQSPSSVRHANSYNSYINSAWLHTNTEEANNVRPRGVSQGSEDVDIHDTEIIEMYKSMYAKSA